MNKRPSQLSPKGGKEGVWLCHDEICDPSLAINFP